MNYFPITHFHCHYQMHPRLANFLRYYQLSLHSANLFRLCLVLLHSANLLHSYRVLLRPAASLHHSYRVLLRPVNYLRSYLVLRLQTASCLSLNLSQMHSALSQRCILSHCHISPLSCRQQSPD